MKIGVPVWGFTLPQHNPPYEDGVRRAGEMGYDAIELIVRDPGDLQSYWSGDRVARIKALCDDGGLAVAELVLFQNMIAGLADLDPGQKQTALEHFRIGCDMANRFGTTLVNVVSPWPAGLRTPHPYPPNYWYINVPGIETDGYRLESKLKITLPDNFDWPTHWQNYLDSIRQITAIAKQHGLRVAVENHANVMSPQVDSLLRLIDHIPEDNLGVNLDIGWAFIQREDVPWSIHKLRDRLFNLHARDGDGLMCYRLPIGEGILDWGAIGRALAAIGFDGCLSVECSHQALSVEQGRDRVRRVRDLLAGKSV